VSPEELVAQCQAGNVEAFETLYHQHAARLYTLACRMAGSPEDGEDLLQEIFLQAYRKLGSFKGDAAIGTWLYRLALNHCLDYVRSRQAKMNKLTDTLDAETSIQPTARFSSRRSSTSCRQTAHDTRCSSIAFRSNGSLAPST
jgi:RNA polymerase sigma-70 factor (ECF subfamily)